MSKSPKPTMEELTSRIDAFVVGHFSVKDCREMVQDRSRRDAWASDIYDCILLHEPGLAADLGRFTGHLSCQLSLVRNYLAEKHAQRAEGVLTL